MWSKVLKNKWTVVLVIDLVVINLGLLWTMMKPSGETEELVSGKVQSLPVQVDSCGIECRAYIDQKLKVGFSGPSPSPVAKPKASLVVPLSTKSKTRQVQYFSVLGSGQTQSNDWANLSGTEFYFDTVNYPGLIEVSFESTMNLLNGNGQALVRLFDVTHGIAVQGSEVSTGSQASTVISSGIMAFWQGNNLYRVQAKSLTADTAVFSSGRLKITSEN